jgi:predicted RNase H-like nuclease
MAKHVGVDWASKGWVAAELDDDSELDVGFYPTIWNLWYEYEDADVAQILVDIPIGLPEDGRRACDKQAKDELGERRSSVFWAPIREAAYEDNIEDAKDLQEETIEHSISNQAWAIAPRIREVDSFLRKTDDAQDVVRESHPEVCFWKLSDELLESKLSDDGIEDRLKVLCKALEISIEKCEKIGKQLTEPSYARFADEDDVLDAMVLAVTAKRVAEGNFSLLPKDPETGGDHPPTDEKGIPMEIVYPEL